MARVVHTPPPPVTPDENPPVSVSVPTTIEDKPPIFTTQLTTQIEQLSSETTGTKQKTDSPHSSEESSRVPTPKEKPKEDFSEKIKLEDPRALDYYQNQMRKVSQDTLRYKGALTRFHEELKQNRPNGKEAEELWWYVQKYYNIIKDHREDAIKYFSPETKLLDPYMEEKTQKFMEAQDKYLEVYTVLSFIRGEEGATYSERRTPDENSKVLEKRTSTPSMFDMEFRKPPLTYMGENQRLALEPPGLASALIPENREEYRLLPGVINQTVRKPPPPPKKIYIYNFFVKYINFTQKKICTRWAPKSPILSIIVMFFLLLLRSN